MKPDMTDAMEYELSEEIAQWLDDVSIKIDEAIMGVDSSNIEDLHEQMAKAAMQVYREKLLPIELTPEAKERLLKFAATSNIPPLQKGVRGISTPTETTDSPPLAGAQGVDDWVTCPTCDGTQEVFVENTFDGGDIVPCMKCRNGKVRKADEQARKALNIVNKVAVLLLIGLLCLLFYKLDFPL